MMLETLIRHIRTALPSRVYLVIRRCYPYLCPSFLFRWSCRKLTGKATAVYFYPDLPVAGYMLGRICQRLGCRMLRIKRGTERPVMRWDDRTDGKIDPYLEKMALKTPVLNMGCHDISKQNVERVFRKVFGYGSFVDPLSHEGLLVEKSDDNGRHDGRFLQGPLAGAQKECVYQIPINTKQKDGFREEMRIPVFNGKIVLVMKKIKPDSDPFICSLRGFIEEVDIGLKAEEQAQICRFCNEFDLDYGELDILRNNDDGRIYIIDVNNTPSAYFAGFSRKEKHRALGLMAVAFDRAFLSH